MNGRRFLAVGGIFLVACVAWVVLGSATRERSTERLHRLVEDVASLWGAPLVQEAPSVERVGAETEAERWVLPDSSDIRVALRADPRRKGLIWYPTYVSRFEGAYTLRNAGTTPSESVVRFAFPSRTGTLDGFSASLDAAALALRGDLREGIEVPVRLEPGAEAVFRVAYTMRGLRDWRYRLDARTARVRNLSLHADTDFERVDFVDGGLSPMTQTRTAQGWSLVWSASDLVTSQDIGIVVPEKLNPGPLTSRITFFAPVCLFFFFVLIGTINILHRLPIHPMHYLFVAAGFFAFHLLLVYMAGLAPIHIAFGVAAVVSVGLVTSYLAAALGPRFPWRFAAAGQVFYLVLFSYSFFLPGWTGLTIAVGAVATLAVLMRVTAPLDWDQVFAARTTSRRVTPPALPSQG